jgi:hypothetical protein
MTTLGRRAIYRFDKLFVSIVPVIRADAGADKVSVDAMTLGFAASTALTTEAIAAVRRYPGLGLIRVELVKFAEGVLVDDHNGNARMASNQPVRQ